MERYIAVVLDLKVRQSLLASNCSQEIFRIELNKYGVETPLDRKKDCGARLISADDLLKEFRKSYSLLSASIVQKYCILLLDAHDSACIQRTLGVLSFGPVLPQMRGVLP